MIEITYEDMDGMLNRGEPFLKTIYAETIAVAEYFIKNLEDNGCKIVNVSEWRAERC